jgi:hypothetical protein
MVFSFKSWVSHRIDDPALPFVTPPFKKRKTHEKSPEPREDSGDGDGGAGLCGWNQRPAASKAFIAE